MANQQLHILVTGGTGYLGQFLVEDLATAGHIVALTFHSATPPDGVSVGRDAFQVDFASGQGLDAAFNAGAPFDAIINTAAISQPAVCERDPQLASSINAPSALLAAMTRHRTATGKDALLIHISTDQVYRGFQQNSKEEVAGSEQPLNAYGQSKLQGEQLVQAEWPNHLILRPSIIYGPQPPAAPVARALFLQFVDQALQKDEPTSFFEDEWRCPVYVRDICAVVRSVLSAYPQLPPHRVYNMGGPERLSRMDMALIVAQVRGWDSAHAKAVKSASVDRGVQSPADISMDMSRLQQDVPEVRLTPFAQGVSASLAT